MKDFLNFLRTHWIATILCSFIVLFAVIGIPLFINWTFTEPAWCDLLAVDWEAKDTLAYYGSALGFIGTVIFSGLALWQNHQIQEANKVHTQLLEKMERDQHRPILFVQSCAANGSNSNLKIKVINASDNVALDLRVLDFAIVDETGNAIWMGKSGFAKSYLKPDTPWELELGNPSITSDNHQFVFHLKYYDLYNDEYTRKAIAPANKSGGLPTFKLYTE